MILAVRATGDLYVALRIEKRAPDDSDVLQRLQRGATRRLDLMPVDLQTTAAVSEPERERDATRSELADLREEHRLARSEIERLGRETGALDRLLTGLRAPSMIGEIRAALSGIVTTDSEAP